MTRASEHLTEAKGNYFRAQGATKPENIDGCLKLAAVGALIAIAEVLVRSTDPNIEVPE